MFTPSCKVLFLFATLYGHRSFTAVTENISNSCLLNDMGRVIVGEPRREMG